MSAATPFERAREAAESVARHLQARPLAGVILGSGLAGFADAIADPTVIPYSAIPGWPVPDVAGHPGRLILGSLSGRPVAVLQGRAHFYEGFTPEDLALPVRVLHLLGARVLLVTNAAGGLNPGFEPGDLMLVEDHIGLPSLAGYHPLRGPNDPALGPRFPDLNQAYDPDLLRVADEVAAAAGLRLRRGIYAWVSGPSYETPAEVRLLRGLGADAVGMSTVPEVIAARHLGLRVLAVSCITNVLAGGPSTLSHQEVLAIANQAAGRLCKLLAGVLARVLP